ncbi:methyltransferase domain-containing protein [Halomicrococcus sp. NG-SE-24]|uniref:methyltransferase domain-containing protein n=1 Tax=Halomicrococcus sp. NG-SE-24 TaxID=3436928 RepID=UPI003D999A2D
MTEPDDAFRRYLAAKRTVDDRALDRRVLDRFVAELPDDPAVLEVGAGIGTMVERLDDWGLLPGGLRYTAVDLNERNVDAARDRLRQRGFREDEEGDALAREDIVVEFVADDAVAFAHDADRRWDAVVGHAVLDLFDLDDALPALRSAVPGGLCYFSVVFDGETGFEPPLALDDDVLARYHEHLDDGQGSSRAGRRLLARLPDHGVRVLVAGGSDWVVHPRDGGYPADEAYFLRYLLRTIGGALADEPTLDDAALEDWVETRNRQVAAGELVAVVHNLDVLGRVEN